MAYDDRHLRCGVSVASLSFLTLPKSLRSSGTEINIRPLTRNFQLSIINCQFKIYCLWFFGPMAMSRPALTNSFSLVSAVWRLHSQMRSKVERLRLSLVAKYSSKRFSMVASVRCLLPVGPPLTIWALRICFHNSAQGAKEMRLTLMSFEVM